MLFSFSIHFSSFRALLGMSAEFFSFLAFEANLNVCIASQNVLKLSIKVAIRKQLPTPPIDALNKRVNFESRYGTRLSPEMMALITLLSTNNERFILLDSFILSPELPVCLLFSVPARSTRLSDILLVCSHIIRWLRLDCLF